MMPENCFLWDVQGKSMILNRYSCFRDIIVSEIKDILLKEQSFE
ncbi:UNVERIFIED_CONTAM: hypothetical protein NCL1_40895 [Trichonephila clavipes]